MRALVLMRGAPGCGKSTYIKEHNLEQYALSADVIRTMYQSPVMLTNGNLGISQDNETEVWKTLFKILEARMMRGEFVIIDATNSKTRDMTRYKDMAQTYRYRIYCIDFTDVPIDVCKQRNRMREEYKWVPETQLENIYSRFDNQPIPSGIKVIKDINEVWFHPLDFSEYKKIHHIGDIHGCYTALNEYLKDGLKDDELYIFCGDYIDRGIENVEVLKFLFSIMDKKNVILLEGNHERWLWYWAHGLEAKSREFERITKRQLESANVDPKDVRMLYRRLGQCAYYTYHGKTVFVCHAGISKLPENITLIATEQMIRGVGRYSEYKQVAEAFDNNTPNNTYQIFGHRNTECSPIQLTDRCFSLEGRVEFGGCLRVVTLDEDGFNGIEVKNGVFKPVEAEEQEEKTEFKNKSIGDLVNRMRESKYVMERKFGNISSFNFTRDAFYSDKWNNETMHARGLFIDIPNEKVAARSYNKFFAVNEQKDTRFDILQFKFKFPVSAYVKENGFLGIVSYDASKDDFFISSKSTPTGEFSDYLRDMFDKVVEDKAGLKEYIKDNDVSFVFECVDIVNDPHIIKYDKSHLYLLDIIKNDMDFSKLPYDEMVKVADRFKLEHKTLAKVMSTWDEFRDWYVEINQEDYLYNGKHIEGFVVEDTANFMVKVKLDYYKFWKHMRSVMDEVFRTGNYRRTGSLLTPLANKFFGYCKKIKDDDNHPTNIIAVREQFIKETEKERNK